MSLILEALKKSDRNRERGKVPDLQADHSIIVPPTPPLRRFRRWLLPLLLLVALGGGGLLWKLWLNITPAGVTPVRQTESTPAIPVTPPPAPATTSMPATTPLEPAKTSAAPKAEVAVSASASAKQPNQPAKGPAATPAVENSQPVPTEVYELADLPSHIAQGLPELTVSVHYYTPNPESRMVRINNRILREGGSLPGGIKITSIEKNSILCELQGVRFRLPTGNLASGHREENK